MDAGDNTVGYIIYRQDTGNDISWSPTDGTSYIAEQAVGLGRIIYVGNGSSYTDDYD